VCVCVPVAAAREEDPESEVAEAAEGLLEKLREMIDL
jgi:hypothetical protein